MGASCWTYVVPFRTELVDAVRDLQVEVFTAKDYRWVGWDEEGWPATLQELWDQEDYWSEGTHSILDLTRIVPADAADAPRTLRPLTEQECRDCFGTERPSRDDFERSYEAGSGIRLLRGVPRWSGHSTVLYGADGDPAGIALWGCSGD